MTLRLEQVLKREGIFATGGQAKVAIQSGEVLVNGEVETRRKRQLQVGDVIEVADVELVIEPPEEEEDSAGGSGDEPG